MKNLVLTLEHRAKDLVLALRQQAKCFVLVPGQSVFRVDRWSGWKHEFKTPSLTSTILNLCFAEAGQNCKTRNFCMYTGPGSDGSSADKLSFDMKFNPWDAAISFRPERHSMSKTVVSQYDPSESWCTEQKDAWPDDVKTLHHRPIRCLTVVHPYFLAQRDTDLLEESAHLSCEKICIDVSRFSPDPYNE